MSIQVAGKIKESFRYLTPSQNPASSWEGKERNTSAKTLRPQRIFLSGATWVPDTSAGTVSGPAMLKASQARRAEREQGGSEAGGSDSLKLQQMLRLVLPPLLALSSEILVQHLAYKWEESFLSGDTKLRFMHSQSVFSLSVGRSKALKSQTYSQGK